MAIHREKNVNKPNKFLSFPLTFSRCVEKINEIIATQMANGSLSNVEKASALRTVEVQAKTVRLQWQVHVARVK